MWRNLKIVLQISLISTRKNNLYEFSNENCFFTIIFLAEERNRSLRERLELQEKRWNNHINEQKQQNSKNSSKDKTNREFEERLHHMQIDVADKNEEISSLRSRESSNEEYSSRLARKLDRIMAENHNRTQKELRT